MLGILALKNYKLLFGYQTINLTVQFNASGSVI